MLDHCSVATKILLPPSLGLLILLLTGIGSWWVIERQQEDFAMTMQHIREPYRAMAELPTLLARIQKNLYMASVWASIDVKGMELQRLHNQLNQELTAMHGLVSKFKLNTTNSALEMDFSAKLTNYEKLLNNAVLLSNRNPALAATAARGTEQPYHDLVITINEIITNWDKLLRNDAEQLQQKTRVLAWQFLLLIALAIGFTSLLALALARSIGRPILAIVAALDELRRDNLDIVIAHTDRGDEIGRVAQAVAEFRKTLRQNKALETQREEFTNKLERLAYRDTLTGLGNRSLFHRHLQRSFTTGAGKRAKTGLRSALLLLDLDRFKEVNDTLGHEAGDILLQEVANRLQLTLRPADGLYRLGGDEFAIILDDLQDTNFAATVAERILETLSDPFLLHGVSASIGASIGIAEQGSGNGVCSEVVRYADLALYEVKESGRDGYRFFEARMNASAQRRRFIERELRIAIDTDQLMVYYQPQFTLSDRSRLMGLEALMRWQHPVEGWISPGEFVAVAEQCALIAELDNWMLRAVFGQIDHWRCAGIELPRIAINVSAQQFRSESFIELAGALMGRYNGCRPRITLELTETVFLGHHVDDTSATFALLRQAGYELALDDFGTGYSSLGYLRNIPIQELKIDASFVRNIDSNDKARKLVKGISSLGHSLGLRVVAEGVETEAECACLKKLGCDMAQGFLFARPQPVEQTELLLQSVDRMPQIENQLKIAAVP